MRPAVRPTPFRSRFVPRALGVALVLSGAGAASAHAGALGPPDPHSPNAEEIRVAYYVMLALAVLLVLAVYAALLFALRRFRERRGAEPRRLGAGRGALVPVVAALSTLAAAIFVFGIVMTERTLELEESGGDGLGAQAARLAQVGVEGAPSLDELEMDESASAEEPSVLPDDGAPLVINAIAQQWVWRFEYPGGRPGQRLFTYGELVVPVDTTVVLNITSTDVIHRWFVPELGGQVDAIPGRSARTWFKVDEEGRYDGQSTAYSGTAYPAMRSWVRAVPAAEYEAYTEELQAELDEAQAAVAERSGGAAEGEAP